MKTIIRKQFAALLVSLFAVSSIQAMDRIPGAQSLSSHTTVLLQKVAATTQEVVTSGMQNIVQNPQQSIAGAALGYGFFRNMEFAVDPEFSKNHPMTSNALGISAILAGGIIGSCHLPPSFTPLTEAAMLCGVGYLFLADGLNHYNYNYLKDQNSSLRLSVEEKEHLSY